MDNKQIEVLTTVTAAIIACTVIATIFAMVPAVMAYSRGDNFNHIQRGVDDTVLVGQNVKFEGWADNSKVKLQKFDDGQWYYYAGPWYNGKVYGVNWDPSLALRACQICDGSDSTNITVKNPKMPLKLKVEEEVSTIAVGQKFWLDVGGINLFDDDRVDLVIVGPDGRIKYDSVNDQQFTNITVKYLKDHYGNKEVGINTSGWIVGDYTVQIKTKREHACGLDMSSAEKSLTIRKGEISIEADKTCCIENENVKITVKGVYGDKIAVDGGSPDVQFKPGVYDTPEEDSSKWSNKYYRFTDTIDEDGVRTYAVKFTDTGSYTIRVDVIAGSREGDYDTVDISVTEKEVTFDVPSTIVIGQKFTVKGYANTGHFVTIAVEDRLYRKLQNLMIDENGEFSKDIDTASDYMPEFKTPGSVTLKAYIFDECQMRKPDGSPVPSDWSDDGSTAIMLTRGGLTANVSSKSIAQGDDFTITGEARGSKNVDILIIPPKGSGGSIITGARSDGLNLPGAENIYHSSASVSGTNYRFTKRIRVDDYADNGRYLVVVLSKGSDDMYGKAGYRTIEEALEGYTLSGKTQDELLEIIEDATTGAVGSGDLMWIEYISVGTTGTLVLHPPQEVIVGDPLNVSGVTNSRDGSLIWITVKGRYCELMPQVATVHDGKFNATFNTQGVQPGVYTITARDGYGHSATTMADIIVPPYTILSFDTGTDMGSYPSVSGIFRGTITLKPAAMPPMSKGFSTMACSRGDKFNHIYKGMDDTVLVGQNVKFEGWYDNSRVLLQKCDGGQWFYYAGPWSNGEIYDVNWDPSLTLRACQICDGSDSTNITVKTPKMPLKLKVGNKEVSTIVAGVKDFWLDVGGINLFDDDRVDLVIIGPDGQIKAKNGQNFTDITVRYLKDHYGRYGEYTTGYETLHYGIDTTGWVIGDYTFCIKTKHEHACGLDMSSAEKRLTLRKGEISIEADKTCCIENETVKITVRGVYGDKITVDGDSSTVQFKPGIEDTPVSGSSKWIDKYYKFADTIDEDGVRTYAVKFTDTGPYTIRVDVNDGLLKGDYDTVDISVTAKEVTFDVPSTIVIGKNFTVRGYANTGHFVTVAIDGMVYPRLDRMVLTENGEFHRYIEGRDIPELKEPGPVTLTAYIDRAKAGTYPAKIPQCEQPDGRIVMYVLNSMGGGIDITASKCRNIDKNETIMLTIRALPGHIVDVTSSDPAHTVFECRPTSTRKTVAYDGTLRYAVHFSDFGTYKLTATDYGTGGSTPLDSDNITVTVSEMAVTFDVPRTGIIGERLSIRGHAKTGHFITVAVEGKVYRELDHLAIDANGEFSKDIDTAYADIPEFKTPGSVTLSAYIDRPYESWNYPAAIGSDEWANGSTRIFMVRGWLTANLSAEHVEPGDKFWVYGYAPGSRRVDILIIPPKGSAGTIITGARSDGLNLPGAGNIYHGIASVSGTDHRFMKRIRVDACADNGRYLVVVLGKGSDGKYGRAGYSNIEEALERYSLSGKTQNEILEIIEDATFGERTSDDHVWVGYIGVGMVQTLILDPVADVAIGEPLEITGESSMSDGSYIYIAVRGRYRELASCIATVHEGRFSAIFDTSDALPGTYTVRAMDECCDTAFATVHLTEGTPAISETVEIHRMYTYSCPGTGGHSEYVAFYAPNGTKIGEGVWQGYQNGDYHYINFDSPLVFQIGKTYRYEIHTGSYPLIIHRHSLTTTNGTITCSEFIDLNGIRHTNNWIPAIRLE